MGATKNNFRRLLLTFEALSDLGPAITAESDFSETAPLMLTSLMDALDAREGALFRFSDKPAMLSSISSRGYNNFPQPAVIPLLPRQVHALLTARRPLLISSSSHGDYLSSNGNVAPELFRCITPLRVGARLVGMIALGQRTENAVYEPEELESLSLLSHYVGLAIHNNTLSESLAQRVSENLKLMASLHNFYDNALEAFAAAIDSKHVNIHGHSLRVGRYAAGIAEAMGMDPNDISGMRAAGYLHDIGKVAVDKAIFAKPAALDSAEFREMADHTVVGYEIVTGVEFPWPRIPEIVRSHHERSDGTGYPDHLHAGDLPPHVLITAVADTFDAMTSERPYRHMLSVGETLSEIVKLTPNKFDPAVVQALLIQVRRDSVSAINPQLAPEWGGSPKARFLDDHLACNIAPSDVDHLNSMLSHRITNGRAYNC